MSERFRVFITLKITAQSMSAAVAKVEARLKRPHVSDEGDDGNDKAEVTISSIETETSR